MFVIPSIILNFIIFSLPSPLVKMSTTCSLVEQCIKWTVLSSTLYRIKWYLVLMCLVRSWNLWFLANLIAEVLLTSRGFEFTCFSCKSSSIFLSHTISFVAFFGTTYSTYVVESIGTDCLHDLQETTIDPILVRYPEVDTPFSLPPSKSKLECAIRLNSSILVYLSP